MPELRTVLMFAPSFAPIASPGTHRPLRFSKYLPEFGWRAAVVTVSPETLHGPPIDHTLTASPESIVQTAPIWRPLHFFRRVVYRPLVHCFTKRRVDRKEHSDKRHTAQAECQQSRFDELCALLFATPDQNVGWTIPALWAGIKLFRQYKPEVIYSTGPPHSSHLVALLLKCFTGLPTVIDLRDPWARNPLRMGERGRARNACHTRLERMCVRYADQIILNTQQVYDDFVNVYGTENNDKFSVIPNGFDPALTERISGLAHPFKESANRSIRLCHPGALFGPRNLGPCIEALNYLCEDGKQFILEQVGRVEGPQNLSNAEGKQPSMGKVTLHGHLQHEKTLEIMAASDILVVLQAGTKVQVPSKLFEMLPFCKPILALADPGAVADMICEFRLGAVAAPSDSKAIAEAIRGLTNGSSQCFDMGRREDACQLYDGRKLTGKLAVILSRMIDN